MSDVLRHMAHLYMAHHMAALFNEAMPQSFNKMAGRQINIRVRSNRYSQYFYNYVSLTCSFSLVFKLPGT